MEGQFVLCNPPAPVIKDTDPIITTPALISIGVVLEKQDNTFRCGNRKCDRLQPVGAELGWVRDEFRVGDSWKTMVETHQASLYNSHRTGWCGTCCLKLLPPPPKPPTLLERLVRFLDDAF